MSGERQSGRTLKLALNAEAAPSRRPGADLPRGGISTRVPEGPPGLRPGTESPSKRGRATDCWRGDGWLSGAGLPGNHR